MGKGRIGAGLSAVVAGALVVGLWMASGCATATRIPREAEPAEPVLRVMTFNVNYGLAGDGATLAAIEEGRADVVFLQETTPEWERVLRRELSGRYPHMAFRHSGGAGGLGVLSRLPFEEKDFVASPSGWFPAWRVVVATALGRVQVLSVHLHPPISDSGSVVSGYFTTGSVRREEIGHFERFLEAGLPTLVVGDLNEGEGGGAARLLAERGLRSVLPEYDPEVRTWRWQTSVGEITSRLDHIFYDSALEPMESHVVEAGRSDHLPVVATFVRAR